MAIVIRKCVEAATFPWYLFYVLLSVCDWLGFICVQCEHCDLLGFEALQKAFQKAKSVVEKEGGTPTFYIRTLVELEDFVQNVSDLQLHLVHMHIPIASLSVTSYGLTKNLSKS